MATSSTRSTPKSAAAERSRKDESTPESSEDMDLKQRLLQKRAALSENARLVLDKRYLRKDEQGATIETPEEMFYRVARNIASAEGAYSQDPKVVDSWTERFYDTMISLDFLPNSPTLMNAGRELQQLSACFVLPVGDSMDEIFTAVRNTALIHKSGGGTGFSFSNVRPKNDRVKSTTGISSGPLSFMRVFDVATETVKQGGTRRGANMGILSCHHPEIMDFISMKEQDGVLSNFNISVAITDEFMDAYKRNTEYVLRNPRTAEQAGVLSARKVFKKIVDLAWKNGEPGIVFIDRINRDNPTPHIGRIESTNPCGEQPLLPYESCNLGSLNLAHMTRVEKGIVEIDYAKLSDVVNTAVRFLDDVIDMNRYPLPEIDEMTKRNRKIGLGVMGFADMLIDLGIPYNSPAAIEIAERLMLFINEEGHKVSAYLARERGVFPSFEGSIFDRDGRLEMRNATVTTVAPTGTISMIAGCSSGIEPLFALVYEKNVLDKHLLEIHQGFKSMAEREGFYSEELMKLIARTGSLNRAFGIPKRIRDVFVTSHDIDPHWHISLQAAFQKHTDNAVSKTVNFRHTATAKEVEEVYLYAFEMNCKGVTVYRDGSRAGQVITSGSAGGSSGVISSGAPKIHPRQRPAVTFGRTYKTKTGCGTLYVNVNADEFGMCEVFTQMGKSGGCAASNAEAVSRLVSLSLRSGIDPRDIVSQLRGIRCPIPTWEEGKTILSCADAIGSVIEKAVADFNGGSSDEGSSAAAVAYSGLDMGFCPECPECGGLMEHEGGCSVCKSCGFSKCG